MTSAAPVVDVAPRCRSCGKKLAEEVARPWRIRCTRGSCKALNTDQDLAKRHILSRQMPGSMTS